MPLNPESTVHHLQKQTFFSATILRFIPIDFGRSSASQKKPDLPFVFYSQFLKIEHKKPKTCFMIKQIIKQLYPGHILFFLPEGDLNLSLCYGLKRNAIETHKEKVW